jgi:hypothetical protein
MFQLADWLATQDAIDHVDAMRTELTTRGGVR